MGKYRNKQNVDRKVMLLYMMYACICTCIGASNICPHDRNGLVGAAAAAAARKSAWRGGDTRAGGAGGSGGGGGGGGGGGEG